MNDAAKQSPLVVYVDIDDTLIRSVGTKRIPIVGVVDHVRNLYSAGAQLFCWSSGGRDYAQAVAEELGIANCFTGFLPKPHVILDDQPVGDWRRCLTVHPSQCESESAETYWQVICDGK